MCGVTEDLNGQLRRVLRDAAIFAGVFVVASLLAALIWQSSVELPRWQRSSSGISMGPVEATKTIGIDAVFLFVSAPIALVLGALLTFWRRNAPLASVVLIAFMSVGAAALTERFGLLIGPAYPGDVLRHAAVGATAPVQLQIQATGVLVAWPAAAMLGALLVLLVTPSAETPSADELGSDKLSALPLA